MGYGLEQHETDGYKSPRTISPALMKREAEQPHTHTLTHSDFVQSLHLAPAEEIFKDPLWVTPPLPLLVLKAQNGCLKYSRVACERTSFAFLCWDIFWHTLEMIVEFITFITSRDHLSCQAVKKLCNCNPRGTFKSWCWWPLAAINSKTHTFFFF